ncbi:hypothetical protein GCM10022243_32220 [Saccharothrix violaceirubra]
MRAPSWDSASADLVAPGEFGWVRQDGEWLHVRVQPYDEALVRALGGVISVCNRRGIYRNYFPWEIHRNRGASGLGDGRRA